MSPVVLVLVALVAVAIMVAAFRLDERRQRTGRGLWAWLRDLRQPPPLASADPRTGVPPRRSRARAVTTLVPIVLLAGGLAAVAWWLSNDPGAPADGETAPADDTQADEPLASPAVPDEATAVQLAVAFSQQAFPEGGADHVILTRAQPSVDALAAGGLQGLLTGPLLLTASDQLSPETAEEIDRLGTPEVHVLGGEDAVSNAIEEELAAGGHDVHRHAGPRGVDTAIDVAARHFPDAQTAIVAPTTVVSNDADVLVRALTAGGLAAAGQLPILLTEGGALNASTGAHLVESAITSVFVLGTEEEVLPSVVEQLEALGLEVTRVGDADRYVAAAALSQSEVFASGATPTVLLADGSDERLWPGLSFAAVYAARENAPLLLSDGDALPEATRGALDAMAADTRLICVPGVLAETCEAARDTLQR